MNNWLAEMPYHRWRRSTLLGRSDRLFRMVPAIVAGTYAVVSAIWIVCSDRLLVRIAGNYPHYQTLQTWKGWFFISLSALVIFFMLRTAWKGISAAYEASRESERRLQLALAAARGGAWELDLTGGVERLTYVSPELTRQMGVREQDPLTIPELLDRIHPDDVEQLRKIFADAAASTGEHLYEARYRALTKSGTYGWVHSRGSIVPSERGKARRMIGVSLDISRQKRAEDRVDQLLRYDPLTGLAKQNKFLFDVDDTLAQTLPGDRLAVVQVRLKDLGHLIGDTETVEDAKIIRLIGDRLQRLSESGASVSRLAHDSFAVATQIRQSSRAVLDDVGKVLALFTEPQRLNGRMVRLRHQAGAALFPRDGAKAHGLLRNAGHALDKSDHAADGGIRWFTEGLDMEFRTRNERLRDLAGAVANGEIECHFQPIVNLETGETVGFEALARWRRRGEGLVAPDQFIALAEESGHISAIGEEMLGQACRAAAGWGHERAPYVSVNVSPVQLDDPVFPATIARILAESGLSPRQLELEITENALTSDPAAASRRLDALRQLGISIAIDDFGTGYSSLALLSRLPFTRLKIDRSFIAGYGRRHESTIIVDMMIDLCRDLDLSITAEGVETGTQAEMLAGKGVTLAQGFLFSPPVPLESVAPLVGKKWPVEFPRTIRRQALRQVRTNQG